MLLINIHLLCNVFFVNINIRSRSVTAEKSISVKQTSENEISVSRNLPERAETKNVRKVTFHFYMNFKCLSENNIKKEPKSIKQP